MIQNRFYTAGGKKWEARFFHKGDIFPDTAGREVPRQGVWARPVDVGWEESVLVGTSWRFVNMDVAVDYLSDHT